MINNDVLRSIRYMLDLSDQKLISVAALADSAFSVGKEEMRAMLLKEDEPGHVPCSDEVLAHVLDGLIIHLRGREEGKPPRPVEKRISNNVVLKKLRGAFQLTALDNHRNFAEPGTPVAQAGVSGTVR